MRSDVRIEIVRTENQRFSSMGVESSLKMLEILKSKYENVGVTIVNNAADLDTLVQKKPDLVFLGLKKLPAHMDTEDSDYVWISEFLDDNNVSYTGSSQQATSLDYNKELAKAMVRTGGLATADSFTAKPGDYTYAADLPLPFPLFIKPLDIGAGKGVDAASVVRSYSEFQAKVSSIYDKYQSVSLVETYLPGREFSVAILDGHNGSEPLLMPIEIVTDENERGDRILGSRIKAEDNEVVVGVDDPILRSRLRRLSHDIYSLLGARDYGRIDLRMDAHGSIHFLEANFMPGPGTRYFAGACKINEDMEYEDVLESIVELGLARNMTGASTQFQYA